MNVGELLEILSREPKSKKVLIEANESGYSFSDINSVKTYDVDYENADGSIEEITCLILSEK